MSAEVIALVNYYARNAFSRHVQTVCNEVLKKRAAPDATLLFWRAFGMLQEGALNEAIKELQAVEARGDAHLSLPVKLALLHAHQQARAIDEEEVARLRGEVDLEEQNAPERARMTAALLLWHLGDAPRARMHAARLLSLQPQSVPALTLVGWLELGEAAEPDAAAAAAASGGSSFDEALAACAAKKDLEALMGKAALHAQRGQHREALEALNQVIVLYAWFLPALVEKFLVLVATGDWEQAVETAQRVLSQDAHNIEALRLSAAFLLSQEGRCPLAADRVSDLAAALERQEPQNARLYYRVARPLARLAGRHAGVLQLTLSLVDRACRLAPARPEYAAEYAYQQMLLGDLAGATTTLKRAAALEEGSQEVLQRQIKCQILAGQLDEAETQLDFIAEIQASIDRTPEMALNAAALAWHKRHSREEAVAQLDEAVELHMAQLGKARARAHRAASNRRKPRPRPGGGAAGRRRRPRAWGMAHGAREEPAAATHPPPARVAGASLGGVLCAPQPRDAPRDCKGVPPALRRRSGGGGPGVAGRRRPLEGDQAAHPPRRAGAGRRGEAGEAGEGGGGAPPPAAAASRSLHHPVSAPFRGTQTPGLLEAQLLLARSRYLGGEFDEALRCCAACAKARAPRCARIRDGWRPPSPGR